MAPKPRTNVVIQLTKQAFWRGTLHKFQNTYVIGGGQPSVTQAQNIIDVIHEVENQLFPATPSGSGPGFITGKAYPIGLGPAYAERDYNPSGAIGSSTGFEGLSTSATQAWAPTLETCLLAEQPLINLNLSGKPVSLRKFYRGIMFGAAEDDVAGGIPANDVTAINGVLALLSTTPFPIVSPSGNPPATAWTVHPFLVAHQVPRGKKKKKTTLSQSDTSNLLSALINDASHLATIAGTVASDA